MTEQNVDFKIISNKNENVYCEGYVEIPQDECEDEEIEWYYWTGNGYQTQPYYHHDAEEITGLTREQNDEIDNFIENYREDALWIDTVILQSDEDENRTYVRKDCTLIINEGAKMECEIEKPSNYRGDYVVEVIPNFNGEKIDLTTYMKAMGETFDPWGNNDPCSCIEEGHIYFEMSKDYWESDKQDHDDRLNDVNEEACRIYARALTYEMGIYAKYGEVMEQSMDNDYDDEWLLKMSLHKDDSDEELDSFLREEGFIDEELE